MPAQAIPSSWAWKWLKRQLYCLFLLPVARLQLSSCGIRFSSGDIFKSPGNLNLHSLTIGKTVSTEWGCHRNKKWRIRGERSLTAWLILSPGCQALNIYRLIAGVCLLKWELEGHLSLDPTADDINMLRPIGRYLSRLIWRAMGMGWVGCFVVKQKFWCVPVSITIPLK